MPYYFNLPIFDDLTPDQKRAVNETHQLALGGGPGTGKSVVCLWRHIRNYATNTKKSLLLTYTKTLEHYLRQSANSESEECGQNIDRIFWWLIHNKKEYEEIIIDEGQDILKDKFQEFFKHSKNISYGADERQSIYLKEKELRELFNWLRTDKCFNSNVVINLSRNFRNSKEILLFTRSVFPDFLIPQNTINNSRSTGLKPILKLKAGWGIKDQCQNISQIIDDFASNTHNIGILVPFASMVDNYYKELREILQNDIEVTRYQNEYHNFSGLSGIHITTFKSAKGTEFDTVIIPEFDRYSWIMRNGSQIENRITKNDYYVAFTRAKLNLFLICKSGSPIRINRDIVNIE